MIKKYSAGIPGCHMTEIKKYRIATYMRLSKEDSSGKEILSESSSIISQRLLLRDFVEKNFTEYTLLEFCDDGYTGTNFDRPGMKQLLDMVKDSAIDCIIVKDFSRFARDYIALGSYMEQIFPFMGIRFISVNDGYDSEKGNGNLPALDMNFRNLLYDLYSKDLSQKVRSALASRKEKGNYVSGNCPFGYEKAPDDRHMLVIAPDEAAVVRRIFDLTENGYTSTQIAKLFNTEQVKTPVEFKMEKGRTTRTPKAGKFLWTTAVVCQILSNPVYAGDIVYGKYKKDSVGGKNHLKPKEEWKVFRDHHEPIIDREWFDRVQEDRGKKRPAQYRERHPLVGKLVCGCCGRNLTYRSCLNPYFMCRQRYVGGMGKETHGKNCVEKVNVMYLEQYLLYMLYEKLQKDGELEQLKQEQAEKTWEMISKLKDKREELLEKCERLKQEHFEAYKKYVCGETEMFQSRQEEMKSLEKKIETLEREIAKMEEVYRKESYGRKEVGLRTGHHIELTNETVDRYIRRIVVHDEQDMEIEWSFWR